jgi:hypothetical protein
LRDLADRTRSRRRFAPNVSALEGRQLLTLTVQFDYTYDTAGFFSQPIRRTLLNAAAQTLTANITTNLSAITPSGTNTWSATTFNPANTTTNITINNASIPANTIIVYVGGSTLGGSEAGLGGPGGFSDSGSTAWINAVGGRGQAGALISPATAFSPWGGSVSFDTGGTSWYFGTGNTVPFGQLDFYSVAEHELGHVLGIGTADSFDSHVSGSNFIGSHAEAAHGGLAVPLDPGRSHWDESVTSGGQQAVMTPILPEGTRLGWTALDQAGLQDIGWTISIPVAQERALDYYGVGKSSEALFSAQGGFWVLPNPATGAVNLIQFGAPGFGDIPVAGDFDATGRAELAVFGPASGTWSILNPISGVTHFVRFGATNLHDLPVPGDYDGVGRTEFAIFSPSNSTWIILNPNTQTVRSFQFGAPNLYDIPIPGDYDGIGRTEPAVFSPASSTWTVYNPVTNTVRTFRFGAPNLYDIPASADYDGIGRFEPTVFSPTSATWTIYNPLTGTVRTNVFGATGLHDIPVASPVAALVKGSGLYGAFHVRSSIEAGTPAGPASLLAAAPADPSTPASPPSRAAVAPRYLAARRVPSLVVAGPTALATDRFSTS